MTQGRSRWWDQHAAKFISEHPLAGTNWRLHVEDLKARANRELAEGPPDLSEPPLTPEEEEAQQWAGMENTLF